MDKDHILAILRQHEPELKAAGLLHLRLFGSMARGENTPGSDVDLFFDCDESESRNVLHAYGMEDRLTEILGVPAHLSSEKRMRDEIRAHAALVTIRVF